MKVNVEAQIVRYSHEMIGHIFTFSERDFNDLIESHVLDDDETIMEYERQRSELLAAEIQLVHECISRFPKSESVSSDLMEAFLEIKLKLGNYILDNVLDELDEEFLFKLCDNSKLLDDEVICDWLPIVGEAVECLKQQFDKYPSISDMKFAQYVYRKIFNVLEAPIYNPKVIFLDYSFQAHRKWISEYMNGVCLILAKLEVRSNAS